MTSDGSSTMMVPSLTGLSPSGNPMRRKSCAVAEFLATPENLSMSRRNSNCLMPQPQPRMYRAHSQQGPERLQLPPQGRMHRAMSHQEDVAYLMTPSSGAGQQLGGQSEIRDLLSSFQLDSQSLAAAKPYYSKKRGFWGKLLIWKLFNARRVRFQQGIRTLKSIFSSVGTSSGSSSFTARFYKGSIKVAKARARLDHKIAKLGKAPARNVRNEPDFCPKIIQ